MKIKLISLLIFAFLFAKLTASTHIKGHTINVDTTWAIGGSPYYVDGDIIIADGAIAGAYNTPVLTIEPGVQVVFTGYYKITVHGALIARGTATNKIIFRKGSTDAEPGPEADTSGLADLTTTSGGWHGIHWDNDGTDFKMWDNDSSILEYCVFKYSKTNSTDWLEKKGGAVRIRWEDDFIRFSHCEFLYNVAREGGAIYNFGNLHVDNCLFKYNKAGDIGGAVSLDSDNPVFTACVFQFNTSLGYAGAINFSNSNATITNSQIVNNTAKAEGGAINMFSSNDYFANNIIANNKSSASGAILVNNANPVFVNNTITNNQFKWASAVTFWSFSAARFYNTIFWGNKDESGTSNDVFIDKPTAIQVFSNCIIAQAKPAFDGITWENNINSLPLFVNPTIDNEVTSDAYAANWRLQDVSPAINMGIENIDTKKLANVDVYKQNRRLNGLIDIGAAEAHVGHVTADRIINSKVYWNADTVLISTDSIFIDLTGEVIIAPGTKVLFISPAYIVNRGVIVAKGTKQLPITFTRRLSDTTGFSNLNSSNGGWKSIIIDNEWQGAQGLMSANDSSIFVYCNFSFAKKIIYGNDHDGGAFSLACFSKIRFTNCVFENNIGYNGGAIYMIKYANPIIDHCRFVKNIGVFGGGAVATAINSNPIISNCLFTNNHADNGGSIDLNQGKAVLFNNIVCNNSAKNDGGGIRGINTNSLIINNTIVNNEANYGGGVLFYTGGSTFYNTVFWDNNALGKDAGDQIIMNLCKLNLYNCNISTKNVTYSPTLYPDVAFSWQGDTANLFSTEPFFKSIVAVGGNGLLADYSITNLSGNINKGTTAISGFVFPTTDYNGNSRVNDGKIDIGAVENQGGLPVLTQTPVGGSFCKNDTIKLNVLAKDSVWYQWQKDGTNIEKATKPEYSVKGLKEINSGSYQCIVKNGYGTVSTGNIAIQVNTAPEIISQPQSQWLTRSVPYDLSVLVNGSQPLNYKWVKGTQLLTSDTTGTISFSEFDIANEGLYKCTVSNACGSAKSNVIALSVAPELNNISGASVCENDTFKLSIEFNDAANYQWYKDRVAISTAKNKDFQIPKPTSKQIGNYSCKISNSIGNVTLGPVYLSIKKVVVPDVLDTITYVDASLSVTLEASASGDEPLTYQWYKNNIVMKDTTSQSIVFTNVTKSNEKSYKCLVKNSCNSVETNETKLVIAPQLCMVTNDFRTDTNANLLVWDRNSSNQFHHFNIYRESYIKGKFEKIGEVPYKDYTYFIDKTVNPKSQAYVYKITAVDANNIETDIDATAQHKTIHLLVTEGVPKGIQLDWDEYIGFDYLTYVIYRSVNDQPFDSIHSMASTSRTWTDFDAPTTKNLKYFVSVRREIGCDARTKLKAGAGPFASAVSNMEDNARLKFTNIAITGSETSNFSVYPNPFSGMAQLKYKLEKQSDVSVVITDLSGRQVEKLINAKQLPGDYALQTGNDLFPGVYLLTVRINNQSKNVQIVKLK
jgi:hypothetical protein